jgi:hypothetical protein
MFSTVLRNLTPRRRIAIVFAAVWFVVFAAIVFPAAVHTSPDLWPIAVVLVGVALSAFATSAAAVELVRSVASGLSSWSDERHFRVVFLVFAVLLVVQLLGVLTATRAHGHSAF